MPAIGAAFPTGEMPVCPQIGRLDVALGIVCSATLALRLEITESARWSSN